MTFLDKVENAKKLIAEYVEKYPRNGIAVSFGKDSLVVLHLAQQVKPGILVFAALADTEFPETWELRDTIVKKWKVNYREYLYKNDPTKGLEDCCKSKKVEQFREAVKDLDCWFSGIRRDEGYTREGFEFVEEKDGLVKVNPILEFTEKDIWRYIAINEIPFHPKYKEGYRSLSCKLCSAKEQDENEPERAGRWAGTASEGGECGIHVESLKN